MAPFPLATVSKVKVAIKEKLSVVHRGVLCLPSLPAMWCYFLRFSAFAQQLDFLPLLFLFGMCSSAPGPFIILQASAFSPKLGD